MQTLDLHAIDPDDASVSGGFTDSVWGYYAMMQGKVGRFSLQDFATVQVLIEGPG